LQALGGEVYMERIAYLEKVHFKRVAERKAALEKLGSIEGKNRVRETIKQYRPHLNVARVSKLTDIICDAGDVYNYDPVFLLAVILTESSFRHRAVSKAGAVGLMQIRPFVGKGLASEANIKWKGRKTLFDPQANVRLGACYLDKLFVRFDGNLQLTLEAYNNGPSKVRRRVKAYGYFSTPYSRKVISTYNKLKNNVQI